MEGTIQTKALGSHLQQHDLFSLARKDWRIADVIREKETIALWDSKGGKQWFCPFIWLGGMKTKPDYLLKSHKWPLARLLIESLFPCETS